MWACLHRPFVRTENSRNDVCKCHLGSNHQKLYQELLMPCSTTPAIDDSSSLVDRSWRWPSTWPAWLCDCNNGTNSQFFVAVGWPWPAEERTANSQIAWCCTLLHKYWVAWLIHALIACILVLIVVRCAFARLVDVCTPNIHHDREIQIITSMAKVRQVAFF